MAPAKTFIAALALCLAITTNAAPLEETTPVEPFCEHRARACYIGVHSAKQRPATMQEKNKCICDLLKDYPNLHCEKQGFVCNGIPPNLDYRKRDMTYGASRAINGIFESFKQGLPGFVVPEETEQHDATKGNGESVEPLGI